MSALLANLLVGLAVAAAFAQACRRYLPLAWRRGLRAALVRRGLLAPLAEASQAAGCGTGCSSCNGCAPAVPALGAARVIPISPRR